MSPVRIPPRRPKGATLIEAMAALVVFTVGILGVLQMNVLASAQTKLALDQTTATTMARDLVDAFERLPYDHPALAPSALDPSDAEFVNIANIDGLHNLATEDFSGVRPIATSTPAISALEQQDRATPRYQVTWRVGVDMDPDGTTEQARPFVVMIGYPTPLGTRQVTVWGLKFNPTAVVGAAAGADAPEI